MAMPSTTATSAYTRNIGEFTAAAAAPNTKVGAIWAFNHHVINIAGKQQLQKQQLQRFVVRSSTDDESSAVTTRTTTAALEEKKGDENAIEVPKEPPSLISALNVEKALRGIPITDADHYARLGLQRGCPYDQVEVAYKAKVDQVMGQELEEGVLNKTLDELKESYTILSSEQERRLYDWSLERSDNPDKYMWPFEADITQKPKGTPPPPEPEDVGPTRLVGYFLSAWLILGFTLSIALNR